jgi:hypothetical protein
MVKPEKEETIEEILERLKGAPRITFLTKWANRIKALVGKRDPAVVFGFTEIGVNEAEKILREYCLDLVESECYEKLMDVAMARIPPEEKYSLDFIMHLERKLKTVDVVERALKLPFNISINRIDQIYFELFQNPNPDPSRICSLLEEELREHWIHYIGEEDIPEADKQALNQVCERVKEVIARRRPKVADWREVLQPILTKRELQQPDIKPYIARIKTWGLDRDVEYIMRGLDPKDVIILIDTGITKQLPNLKVVYYGDRYTAVDFLDKTVLQDVFKKPAGIYSFIKARTAHEFAYFDEFNKDHARIPIICLYSQKMDYILVCDRPAVLIRYDPQEVKVAPIIYAKMVKNLERFGIYTEEFL